MNDFLKSLTSGVARFALAWMLPVSVAVGLFWAALVPALASRQWLPSLTGAGPDGSIGRDLLTALGLAAFATFSISIVLAYSAQFIYRVLEGYHLPWGLARAMVRRQQRRRARLIRVVDLLERVPHGLSSPAYGLALEQLGLYPEQARVVPTRLGNALRALESYGLDKFGLDSQQYWFELVGTAEAAVRQEQEEMRAQVDLFVAAVAVFALLSLCALSVAIVVPSRSALVLAAGSALFVPVAYRGALRNMKDWQNSVRAMVNLGRFRVADGMGLSLPWKNEDERQMWRHVSAVLHYGDDQRRPWLDVFRRGTLYADADGMLRHVPPPPDA